MNDLVKVTHQTVAEHLVKLRKTIVLAFNFSDPIEKGERAILDYLKKIGRTSG